MNIKLLNYCKTSLAKLGKDYCGLQFLSLSDLLYWYMCTLMILCHGIDFVFTHFSHKTSIIMPQQSLIYTQIFKPSKLAPSKLKCISERVFEFFFHFISCRMALIDKKLSVPHPKLRIEGP